MPKLEYEIPESPNPVYADEAQTRIDIDVIINPRFNDEVWRYTAAEVDPGWPHSEEIFARAASGEFGTVAPYIAPPPIVPQSVTPARAKIALHRAGHLEQVEAIVAAAGGEVAIWYANASAWVRTNPYVLSIGTQLNLTSEQIDALFIDAATIPD